MAEDDTRDVADRDLALLRFARSVVVHNQNLQVIERGNRCGIPLFLESRVSTSSNRVTSEERLNFEGFLAGGGAIDESLRLLFFGRLLVFRRLVLMTFARALNYFESKPQITGSRGRFPLFLGSKFR